MGNKNCLVLSEQRRKSVAETWLNAVFPAVYMNAESLEQESPRVAVAARRLQFAARVPVDDRRRLYTHVHSRCAVPRSREQTRLIRALSARQIGNMKRSCCVIRLDIWLHCFSEGDEPAGGTRRGGSEPPLREAACTCSAFACTNRFARESACSFASGRLAEGGARARIRDRRTPRCETMGQPRASMRGSKESYTAVCSR